MMRALSISSLLIAAACGQTGNVASLPVAEAGFDRVVPINTEVHLDGSDSYDPDGATLSYDWRLLSRPAESTAELVAETRADPQIHPDQPGTYLLSLVVSNGDRDSDPDRVSIRATGVAGNVAPVADAGCIEQNCPDEVLDCQGFACWVGHGNNGSLDGRLSSDQNRDSLTYTWAQVLPANCAAECPELPLADYATISDVVTPTASSTIDGVWDYTASAAVGKLTFKLTVSDGELEDSECVSIESINFAPRALVGQSTTPPSVTSGVSFTLDGRSSADSDPLDTISTYAWDYETTTATVAFVDASVAQPTVTVTTGAQIDVTFVLTVTDNNGKSSTCDVPGLSECNLHCCGIIVPVSP